MQQIESIEDTIFTVRVDGKTYRCPVSRAAMYELCKSQNPACERIDSYLELKSKIYKAVERLVKDGGVMPTVMLQPRHFIS
jgi:hypothetical protein